ncbi:MAG: general secretion pathway protein GspK [Candidatus Omnitrophica bacterium]|nr:general secretion pathway protein GspK [Candidatus Omnitrophota bacterium]
MKRLSVNDRGTVVIVALSMIVLFSMMASGLGFRGGLEVKLVKRQLDLFRERYLAEAAVATVQYLIEKDEQPGEDSPLDAWYGEPGWPESVDFGEGSTVTVKVTDEESKININYASEALLTSLFELIDEENELSTEIDELVAGIMNWRGDSAAQGGTKLGEKYKGSLFESLDELYLIKDIKPGDIPKIAPYITVFGVGAKNQAMINPNTASLLVLKAMVLSLAGDENAREDLADALVHYRDLLDSSQELPESESSARETFSYFSPEDIKLPENLHFKLDISNVDPVLQALVAQLLTHLTVDSKFFNIYVDIKENESSLGTKVTGVIGPPMAGQSAGGGQAAGLRARPRRPTGRAVAQSTEMAVLSLREL